MNKCRRCGVFVKGNAGNCPLCGAHVDGDGADKNISEYPEVTLRSPKQIFWQWSLFISIMAIAISMVVDLAVNKTISWSVHVIFGIALPWICIARPILLKFNVRKCLSWGFVGAIVLLFYLNIAISVLLFLNAPDSNMTLGACLSLAFAEPWAFWLGAPIVILVWQSVLEILCIAHKAERAEYEMSLTKLCIVSLICIGISFGWMKECDWGWYVCAGRGAIDVVALCIFAKGAYFGELKRRLHV